MFHADLMQFLQLKGTESSRHRRVWFPASFWSGRPRRESSPPDQQSSQPPTFKSLGCNHLIQSIFSETRTCFFGGCFAWRYLMNHRLSNSKLVSWVVDFSEQSYSSIMFGQLWFSMTQITPCTATVGATNPPISSSDLKYWASKKGSTTSSPKNAEPAATAPTNGVLLL